LQAVLCLADTRENRVVNNWIGIERAASDRLEFLSRRQWRQLPFIVHGQKIRHHSEHPVLGYAGFILLVLRFFLRLARLRLFLRGPTRRRLLSARRRRLLLLPRGLLFRGLLRIRIQSLRGHAPCRGERDRHHQPENSPGETQLPFPDFPHRYGFPLARAARPQPWAKPNRLSCPVQRPFGRCFRTPAYRARSPVPPRP